MIAVQFTQDYLSFKAGQMRMLDDTTAMQYLRAGVAKTAHEMVTGSGVTMMRGDDGTVYDRVTVEVHIAFVTLATEVTF